MSNCQARQEAQEWHCRTCKMRWDMNDPEPPICGKVVPPLAPTAAEKEPFVSALAPIWR